VARIGAATALETRATGISYVFAPCIAVSSVIMKTVLGINSSIVIQLRNYRKCWLMSWLSRLDLRKVEEAICDSLAFLLCPDVVYDLVKSVGEGSITSFTPHKDKFEVELTFGTV
jgi:hypothetical protein